MTTLVIGSGLVGSQVARILDPSMGRPFPRLVCAAL
jgi:hypothetical protein